MSEFKVVEIPQHGNANGRLDAVLAAKEATGKAISVSLAGATSLESLRMSLITAATRNGISIHTHLDRENKAVVIWVSA